MISSARWLVCSALFIGTLAGQGLDVMFVLEASPGTEQAIGLIRTRDLKESDRAGVIGFMRSTQVLQPLTENREAVSTALQRAGTRITVGMGGRSGAWISNVDLTGAIQQACREFEPGDSAERRPVIVVLFASDDPALSARLDFLKTLLRSTKARLFAVAIQRVSPQELPSRRSIDSYPFPAMTAQLVSQLATGSGGRVYKGGWDLKDILKEARKP